MRERAATAAAAVDTQLFLVGSLPEIRGIEGKTHNGRPTLTLNYSKAHPDGPGSVFFRGNVAEAASKFIGLRAGETISRKGLAADLSTDGRQVDERMVRMYASAFNEGLMQANAGVALGSRDGEYFLVPEGHSIIRDWDGDPRPKGVLEFTITSPNGRVTLDGEEARTFDEVRLAEADGLPIHVEERDRRLLESALRRGRTGIDLIINVEPQTGLYIPPQTEVKERYVIDLDDSQVDAQTSLAERNKQSVIWFGDTTASILAEQAAYAEEMGDVPVMTAREQEDLLPSVEALPEEMSLFQQRLLASIYEDVDMPEPTQVFELPTYQLRDPSVDEGVLAGMFAGSRTSRPVVRDEDLREETVPLGVARSRVDRGHIMAPGKQETRISDETIRRAFINRAREIAAHPVLRDGATPEQVIEELGDEVIRYEDDKIDRPITYLRLLGDAVPELTEEGLHRPWDIASILVLMDYRGRVTPEMQALMFKRSETAYRKVRAQIEADARAEADYQSAKEQIRATTQPVETGSIAQETLARRLRRITDSVARTDSLKERMTVDEITAAFPALADFARQYGHLFPQRDELTFSISEVIAATALTFYGRKLSWVQQQYFLNNAGPTYERWLENHKDEVVLQSAGALAEEVAASAPLVSVATEPLMITATKPLMLEPGYGGPPVVYDVAPAADLGRGDVAEVAAQGVREEPAAAAVTTEVASTMVFVAGAEGGVELRDAEEVRAASEARPRITPATIASRVMPKTIAQRLGVGPDVNVAYSAGGPDSYIDKKYQGGDGGERRKGEEGSGGGGRKAKKVQPTRGWGGFQRRHGSRRMGKGGLPWGRNV